MKINKIIYIFIFLFCINGEIMAENNQNLITMVITQNEKVTDPGEESPTANVVIELFPDIAPNHVKQIKTLISGRVLRWYNIS